MFSTSRGRSGFYSNGVSKKSHKKQRSFRSKDVDQSMRDPSQASLYSSKPESHNLNSAILTISIGPTSRLFAAHESVLTKSPYFASLLRSHDHLGSPLTEIPTSPRRIELPSQVPEVFSSVLEYLYKGDYLPALQYERKRGWSLGDSGTVGENTLLHPGFGAAVLKDTLIYCAALNFSLPDLARLALKKQGLQSGISVPAILNSARFAYENTPETEAKLRAHYLALIIRSRDVFKRSGTMQAEMERGGRMWFDLFVAMGNHLDVVADAKTTRG